MKVLLTLLIISIFSFSTLAQGVNAAASDSTKTEEEKPKKKKGGERKVFFGGGLGLGFGGGGGSVNVAPLIGYRLTDRLQVGTRVNYWYVWGDYNDPNNINHAYNQSIYSIGLFSRLIIWRGLYLHLEPEYMNAPVAYWTPAGINLTRPSGVDYTLTERRETFWNVWAGGGFYQGINGQSGLFIQLLYNLNDQGKGVYSNPYLSIGFAF